MQHIVIMQKCNAQEESNFIRYFIFMLFLFYTVHLSIYPSIYAAGVSGCDLFVIKSGPNYCKLPYIYSSKCSSCYIQYTYGIIYIINFIPALYSNSYSFAYPHILFYILPDVNIYMYTVHLNSIHC